MNDYLDCIKYTLTLQKQKVDFYKHERKDIIKPIKITVDLINAPYVPVNNKEFIEQILNDAFEKVKRELFGQEMEKKQ